MKKIISILVIILMSIAFYFVMRFKNAKEEVPDNEMKEELTEPMDVSKKVETLLNELTLGEKIGQMLIISNRTESMTESLKEELESIQPGGFIFFRENFTSYDKTKNLIEEIEKTAKIPLLLGADQEGGRVQRLKNIEGETITQIPSMKEIGDTKDTAIARKIGKTIAEELQVFGINMDFAPVIDVISNPNNTVIGDRSFGTDPTIVANMGISLAKGLEDGGVIPVYKHFPGHGNTEVDSHYNLPVVTKTKEELYNLDLIPFQKAISEGASVIMIGHLAIPNITFDNTPASLSKKLITDILKKEMKYEELVITDALNMKAITDNYKPKEIYELAINAGVDLLLMPEDSNEAIELIKQSIAEKKITKNQINESVKKILTLKYSKMSTKKLEKSYLNNKEHQDVLNSITN